MAGKKSAEKNRAKYATADGHPYLTKRTTVTKAQSAGRKAEANAMRMMGFVIVAENGNIIKRNADGSEVIISEI